MRSALSRSLCHMYHLQASRRLSQPWPQSPRCGDRLKERTGNRERLSNDGSENNPPTWLPAEMKKCNDCCYYYRLHQWCIKQLRRAEDITNVTLSDPRLMSSYPRSNKPGTDFETAKSHREKSDAILKKKKSSHTKEMSDIFGGWEKAWLHRCVESQHARAAGWLVNARRLETDNSPRLSNLSFLLFS